MDEQKLEDLCDSVSVTGNVMLAACQVFAVARAINCGDTTEVSVPTKDWEELGQQIAMFMEFMNVVDSNEAQGYGDDDG